MYIVYQSKPNSFIHICVVRLHFSMHSKSPRIFVTPFSFHFILFFFASRRIVPSFVSLESSISSSSSSSIVVSTWALRFASSQMVAEVPIVQTWPFPIYWTVEHLYEEHHRRAKIYQFILDGRSQAGSLYFGCI
jgi:hypothetical protein